jgi:hypothetical protein
MVGAGSHPFDVLVGARSFNQFKTSRHMYKVICAWLRCESHDQIMDEWIGEFPKRKKIVFKTCEEYVFFGLKDLIQNNVISKGL